MLAMCQRQVLIFFRLMSCSIPWDWKWFSLELNALQFWFLKCQALKMKKTGKERENKKILIVQEGPLSSPFIYLFEDNKNSFFCQMIVFLLPLDGIPELFHCLPSQRTLVRGREHKYLTPRSPSMTSLISVV